MKAPLWGRHLAGLNITNYSYRGIRQDAPMHFRIATKASKEAAKVRSAKAKEKRKKGLKKANQQGE